MIKLRDLLETQHLTGVDLKHVVDTMHKNKGWQVSPKYDVKIGDVVKYKGKQWVVVDGRLVLQGALSDLRILIREEICKYLYEERKADLVTAVKKVFGPKTGMIKKDKKIDGQHQIWIDVTYPATEFRAQRDFEQWQYRKIKKLRKMLDNWTAIFRRGPDNVGVYVVLIER